MKIAIILGTRPEIIKMSPIIRECERLGLDYSMSMDQGSTIRLIVVGYLNSSKTLEYANLVGAEKFVFASSGCWRCHNMSRSLKLSKDRKNKRNNKFLSSDYIIPLKSLVKEAR